MSRRLRPFLLVAALLPVMAAPASAAEPAAEAFEPEAYFDAVFEPAGRVVFPAGDRSAFGLMVGWTAARFVAGPLYVGGSGQVGPLVGSSFGVLGFGGPLVGMRLKFGPLGLEGRLLAGGAFGAGPPAIQGLGPALMPEATLSLKVGSRGVAVSAGYLYVPSLPGLSGVFAGVGY